MKIAAFIDYSDPLGGVLSWLGAVRDVVPTLEVTLLGVATDPERVGWASAVEADAGMPITVVDVTTADQACSAGPAALPEAVRDALGNARLFLPNAYETGYRLAAASRAAGSTAAVVAFSHANEEHYHYLATRYEGLISTFLAADSASFAEMQARLPDRTRDIHLVPHGIAPAKRARRRSVGRSLRLLYVGRIVQRQKRIFDCLGLASCLDRLGVRYELDLIGDGEDRAHLELQAKRLPSIRTLGVLPRAEVLRLYDEYDCLLLFSDFEGMSVALLEAMAHGVVPIVTAVGGASDVVEHGTHGFLWNVGDVDAAARILSDLWRQPGIVNACSSASRERIRERHDVVQCATRVVTALREAVERPRGSAAEARALLSQSARSPYFPNS